jgi:hypothetical protein
VRTLFPIENRGHTQTLADLVSILTESDPFEVKMSDFHLLLFLTKEVDIQVLVTSISLSLALSVCLDQLIPVAIGRWMICDMCM